MRRLILSFALLTSACQADETVTAFATTEGEYTLVSLNGAPFGGTATLNVAETGRVSGKAPCNSYFAAQKAVYPWFELGPIAATRMACPDLAAEAAYFAALAQMTLAEAQGDVLILSNDDGDEMVFQAP